MKQKISVSMDEEKIKLIDSMLENGRFRNRSHVIEYSLEKLLKEEKR
ncbi:hypothetical protein J4427_01000 [Candidatus Woesearchaeota archaeon]|nr:hypothetical protein [Candidatus Woesearchaeota archaeon]